MATDELESPACRMCGGEDFEPVLTGCRETMYGIDGPAFDIVRCRECALAQTRPRPSPTAIGRYYPDTYAGCQRGDAGRSRLRWAQRVFAAPHRLRYGDAEEPPAPPRSGARVLEVGAGQGAGLREMAELGWETWAIEPDARFAARIVASDAAEDDHVVISRAEDAQLPDESFDLVRFPHSLEHMHDPASVLTRARRWLRDDGRVRLWMPDFESFERRLFGRSWVALDVPRHLTHFSRSTITAMLERTGFRVENIVPQFQGTSFGGSVQQALGGRRAGRGFRPAGAVYHAALPAGWLMAGLTGGSAIDVTASPA